MCSAHRRAASSLDEALECSSDALIAAPIEVQPIVAERTVEPLPIGGEGRGEVYKVNAAL